MTILPGFWMPQPSAVSGDGGSADAAARVTNETVLYECPKDACAVSEGGDIQCTAGRTGPLCALCQDNHVFDGETCIECTSPAANWTLLVLFGVMVSVYITFTVATAAKQWRQLEEEDGGRVNLGVATIKIAVSFLQVTAIMGDVSVPWPEAVTDVLFSSASKSSSLPISAGFVGCTLKLGFYSRLDFILVLPFLSMLLLLPVFGLGLLQQRRRAAADTLDTAKLAVKAATPAPESDEATVRTSEYSSGWGLYQTAVLVVLYVLYPSVSKGVVSVFPCSDDIEGRRYLLSDFSVECGTAAHTLHVVWSIVMVLVFVIGFPLISFVVLYRHSDRLYTRTVAKRLLFLCKWACATTRCALWF